MSAELQHPLVPVEVAQDNAFLNACLRLSREPSSKGKSRALASIAAIIRGDAGQVNNVGLSVLRTLIKDRDFADQGVEMLEMISLITGLRPELKRWGPLLADINMVGQGWGVGERDDARYKAGLMIKSFGDPAQEVLESLRMRRLQPAKPRGNGRDGSSSHSPSP